MKLYVSILKCCNDVKLCLGILILVLILLTILLAILLIISCKSGLTDLRHYDKTPSAHSLQPSTALRTSSAHPPTQPPHILQYRCYGHARTKVYIRDALLVGLNIHMEYYVKGNLYPPYT